MIHLNREYTLYKNKLPPISLQLCFHDHVSMEIYSCFQAWKTKKAEANIAQDEYAYVETNTEFTAVDTDKLKYLFGW